MPVSAAPAATVARPITEPWDRFGRWLKSVMPKGLYARSLLIIIVPMVVLQSVVALLFLERHWDLVTNYLSSAVTQEIATLIDVYKTFPQDADHASSAASRRTGSASWSISCPARQLPPPGPKPFFNQLDEALSDEIRKQIGLPFWIDTVGRSSIVEIRIQLPDTIMRVFAPRADVYDPNSWIFLVWMVATSLVVLAIAIAFLRNQIRPIVRLADAAEAFGKGREPQNFRPRGAREVRRAAAAFLEMKGRVERAIEQRTTMLAGVSHDLRTILTRFKLELALLGDSPEIDAIKKDVDEMAAMLEAYLAFARGDTGEQSAPTDMAALLDELKLDTERHGHRASVSFYGPTGGHGAAGGVQALPRQSRHQCRALCLDRRHHRPPRPPLAHRHGRRRRAGHSAPIARRRVQAVPAPRRRAQSGRRRHRTWARDRARHRALAWRRHHAWRFTAGRLAGDRAGAGVGRGRRRSA